MAATESCLHWREQASPPLARLARRPVRIPGDVLADGPALRIASGTKTHPKAMVSWHIKASTLVLPLLRTIRQSAGAPSGPTRMLRPTLPVREPLSAVMRRYSRSGILVILRAGVNPSPLPPPPKPLPLPPAPVPGPVMSDAPALTALPVPATGAAGKGEGIGTFVSGATIGDGLALRLGAAASSLGADLG